MSKRAMDQSKKMDVDFYNRKEEDNQ